MDVTRRFYRIAAHFVNRKPVDRRNAR